MLSFVIFMSMIGKYMLEYLLIILVIQLITFFVVFVKARGAYISSIISFILSGVAMMIISYLGLGIAYKIVVSISLFLAVISFVLAMMRVGLKK